MLGASIYNAEEHTSSTWSAFIENRHQNGALTALWTVPLIVPPGPSLTSILRSAGARDPDRLQRPVIDPSDGDHERDDRRRSLKGRSRAGKVLS